MLEKLQELYDKYAEILEYDPEFYESAKSIRIDWKYKMHQDLRKMNNALVGNKEFIAIQIVKDLSANVVDRMKSLDPNDLVDQFEQFKVVIDMMKDVNEMYTEWQDDFYVKFLEMFMSHGLFEPDELTKENVDPNFFITLDESAKYINSYRYKVGDGDLTGIETANMRMGNDVLIMEDISQFFGYLRNTEREDNVVYAHIILKIEARVDLSHFLVAITYNGHSFISTDAPSFRNPQNKESTRNARRHMETKYAHLAFPYILIDELDEIQKGNTELAVYGSYSFQLYKRPIKEFDAYCKLFLIGIADKLRKDTKIIKQDVMLLSDFVTTKLIGTTLEITPEDDAMFVGYKEKHKKQLNEILETLEDDNETGLVKTSSDLVVSSEYYDKNWLATPTDLELLSKWMALDAKKADVQKKLNEKFDRHDVKDETLEWLNKELNKEGNFKRLWPYIFSGKDVHFEILDLVDKKVDDISLTDGHIDTTNVSMFNERNHFFTKVHLGFDREGISDKHEKARKNPNLVKRSYDDYMWRDECECCGKQRNSVIKYFRINHWQQLCFLLSKTRKELPAYMRVYKSDQLIPYHGNSILDNVHPMSTVTHPSWREFSNGIQCTVHLCKRCVNKLEKQHKIAEETLIKNDGSIVEMPKDAHSIRYMTAF